MSNNDITVGEFTAFLQFAASGTIVFHPGEITAFFSQVRQLLTQYGQMTPELAAQIDLAEQVMTSLFGSGGSIDFDVRATIDLLLAKYHPDTPLSQTEEFGAVFGPGLPVEPGLPGGPDFVVGDIGFVSVSASFTSATASFNEATGDITISGPGFSSSVNVSLVQRVAFDDGYLAFDFAGAAGQAYRLYEAIFDREPDSGGIGYWIRQLDETPLDLVEMARLFIGSDEFVATYGAAVENAAFVELLYLNILGRAGEADGSAFWVGSLETGMTREFVLANFSESGENTANVAPAIADGIFYL